MFQPANLFQSSSLIGVLLVFLLFPILAESAQRPELVLQTGHTGRIGVVAISPDGRWLASASQDSTIKIWNLINSNLLRTFYGHNAKVNGLAISPDGRYIASAAGDGTARIWDVYGGNEVRILSGHVEEISSVAFGAGGQHVLSASTDVVKVWDAATGRQVKSIPIHEKDRSGRITLSPDGRLYAIGGAIPPYSAPSGIKKFVPFAGGFGSTEIYRPLKIVEIASGRELSSIKIDIAAPYATYVISADGRYMAMRKVKIRDAQTQESIRIVETNGGKEVKTLQLPGDGSPHGIGALAFSWNGRWLAAEGSVQENMGDSDQVQTLRTSVHVYDLSTGQAIRKLQTGGWFMPSASVDMLTTVSTPLAFSPDSKIVALGGRTTVELWDANSGASLRALRTHIIKSGVTAGGGSSSVGEQWMQSAQQMNMTEDEMSMMTSDVSEMMDEIYDPENPIAALMGSAGQMVTTRMRPDTDKRIRFSPDRRWLIQERREEVRIWDVSTGNFFQPRFALMAPVSFSPDGRWFAAMEMDPKNVMSGSTNLIDSRELTVRNMTSFSIQSKTKLDGPPEEIMFGPDGSWIAVKGISANRQEQVTIIETQSGKVLRTVPLAQLSVATTTTFSGNGRFVAFGGQEQAGSGSIFDMVGQMMTTDQIAAMGNPKDEKARKKMEKEMKKMSEQMMKTMGTMSAAPSTPQPYQIKVFDLQSGRQVRTLGIEAIPKTMQYGEITQAMAAGGSEDHRIVFNQDGTLVAIEDTDQMFPALKVYNVQTGQPVSVMRISNRPVPTNIGMDVQSFLTDRKRIRPSFGFSPDGSSLAVSIQEPSYAVQIRNVSTGQTVRELRHLNRVDALAFSPDGKMLTTLIRDGSKQIWDVSSGRLLVTLIEFPGARFMTEWLAATPEGLFDGSPAAWGQILWRFTGNTFDVAPVETFFNELYYPGLLAEIYSGKAPQAPRDVSQLDRRQPKVTLTATGDGSNRTIAVQIEVSEAPADANHPKGSGVRDVRLFRNGTLVQVWRDDVLQGQASRILQSNVPIVAGPNQFIAYAFNNDNVKSADSIQLITGADSLKKKGTAYIIAVGVNQYQNADFNLKYAVADAQAFSESLMNAQNKLGNFAKVEIIRLFDQDATKANITAALRALAGDTNASLPSAQKLTAAEPEDAVFLYYAGHGTAQGARFYIIPHDLGYLDARSSLNEESMKTILSHSISDEEMERLFEGIGAGQTLLVIDACNSGQLLEAEEKRRGPMNSKGLAQLAYEKGMYVLAAAQGYQAALEAAKLGHGYLTYALVEEGIKNSSADHLPKDGEIIAREWLDYAAGRVPEMQLEKMQDSRLLQHEVAFVDGEETVKDLSLRSLQQPRVFYRRDSELSPMVILKQ